MALGSWRWLSQLPLGEAQAPQARGVHGLHRHVEYHTVTDAVIETTLTACAAALLAGCLPEVQTRFADLPVRLDWPLEGLISKLLGNAPVQRLTTPQPGEQR